MSTHTLAEGQGSVHRDDAPSDTKRPTHGVPFAAIPLPIVHQVPAWPERRLRVYLAAVARCARRHEYRLTAAELARDARVHLDTARRALRELEACHALAFVAGDVEGEGRRVRFAWLDYEPPAVAPVEPRRGPDRKRRRGAPGGGVDPGIKGGGVDPGIVGGLIQGSTPSLSRSPRSGSKHPPSQDLQEKARGGMDGPVVQELLQLAARFELGSYETAEVSLYLARARDDVARALDVCPLPREWVAFARARWMDPTLLIGTVSPLGAALSARRTVPWFRARYRAACRAPRKRRGAPVAAEQTANSDRTADERAGDEALARVLAPIVSPGRRLARATGDDVDDVRRRQLAELAAFEDAHGQPDSS